MIIALSEKKQFDSSSLKLLQQETSCFNIRNKYAVVVGFSGNKVCRTDPDYWRSDILYWDKLKKVKFSLLFDVLLNFKDYYQCIIYCDYKSWSVDLFNYLKDEYGYKISVCGYKQNIKEKQINFHNFKQFRTKLMITSELNSRGIDFPNVDLIINLTIPTDYEIYLHRLARTTRMDDKSGTIYNLICSDLEKSSVEYFNYKMNQFNNSFQ